MIEIIPRTIVNPVVQVPGSKSYTHRILLASALSNGICHISGHLVSEDTCLTMNALRQMGIAIEEEKARLIVHGAAGRFASVAEPIFLGNSGTSVRLLTALAALGQGAYYLTGTERMAERPIQDLLDGLSQIGVKARSIKANGCPPVRVTGGPIKGGKVNLKCGISSQFLSGLLLIAPLTQKGLEITVVEGPVSRPYIDMTIGVMERLGINVSRTGYDRFNVPGGQGYRVGDYRVEPDASNASYFWAIAAITGKRVKVAGLNRASRQGDVKFVDLLSLMGCTAVDEPDGITVTGGPLSGVDVDMGDMPDLVPTLAVVAACAEGTTTIRNVAHLKAKESDRLTAVATQLSKMGIDIRVTEDGLVIHGGTLKGASIATYDDHRIAMAFAVAGLRAPGTVIENEACVEKSFPGFWQVFGHMFTRA